MSVIPCATHAQSLESAFPEELDSAVQLYVRGQFEQAIKHLEPYLVYADKAHVEVAAWYLTKANIATDSSAIAIYTNRFVEQYPFSAYGVDLLVDLAYRYVKQKNYKASTAVFERALSYDVKKQKSDQILFWLAESAATQKKNDASRAYYLRLADELPASSLAPTALYARGRLFLEEDRYDAATEAFELLRSRYPNDPVTRSIGTALGESYYQQRRFPEAITALKSAMLYLEGENLSKAVYLVAEAHNYLNEYEEASRFYLQYINQNSSNPNVRVAHYGLGWVYHKQNIYHWAADAFGKAVTGDDELSRKALYYKAVNEKLAGRYKESLDVFKEFGKRFKTGFWIEEAYYEWAISTFEIGFYVETIDVCRAILTSGTKLKHPGKFYSLMGEAYFANNEFTRSLQAFEAAEKSTDIDPNVKIQAQFQRAWVMFSNQAYTQAQPIFMDVYRCAQDKQLKGEALFWAADAYFQQEDYGPAGATFDRFIREFPTHELAGAAHYSAGWSHFKMLDYDKAIPNLEKFLTQYKAPAIALFPYEVDTHLRLGDASYALKNYPKAIEHYTKAAGSDPGGDYALFQIANSYYRSDRSYEAVTTLRRMMRVFPSSRLREQAQYNIGYIYFLTGNYDQAIKEFEVVMQRFPGTPWAARAQYNIGDAHYNAGNYDAAVEAYTNVLKKYPRSEYIIEAVNGISYAQFASGKPDSSNEILESFLAVNPRSGTADRLRFRQAENLLQSGDYEAAIRSFREYIRITNIERMIPEAYFNLADAYLQSNQVEEAKKAYLTIADSYPGSDRVGSALANLGRLEYEAGAFQQSLVYFTRLDKGSPRFKTEAQIGMGNAHLELNDMGKANEAYQSALRTSPNNDAARLGLAKIRLRQNDYNEAMKQFEDIAKKNTTEVGAEAQFLMGQLYQQRRLFDEALQAFANVKILFEAHEVWVAKSLLSSSECYQSLGNRTEAINTLNVIIDKFAGTPQAIEASKRLNTKF